VDVVDATTEVETDVATTVESELGCAVIGIVAAPGEDSCVTTKATPNTAVSRTNWRQTNRTLTFPPLPTYARRARSRETPSRRSRSLSLSDRLEAFLRPNR